jgi:hypothetical protein
LGRGRDREKERVEHTMGRPLMGIPVSDRNLTHLAMLASSEISLRAYMRVSPLILPQLFWMMPPADQTIVPVRANLVGRRHEVVMVALRGQMEVTVGRPSTTRDNKPSPIGTLGMVQLTAMHRGMLASASNDAARANAAAAAQPRTTAIFWRAVYVISRFYGGKVV